MLTRNLQSTPPHRRDWRISILDSTSHQLGVLLVVDGPDGHKTYDAPSEAAAIGYLVMLLGRFVGQHPSKVRPIR